MESCLKIRSFIAINLPDELKKYLSNLIEQIKSKNFNPDIRWVNPLGIHVTLHFLGYLNQNSLSRVKDIIKQTVADQPAVSLELTEINGFPGLKNPRVLFLGCQEIDEKNILVNIKINIGRELKKMNIEVDERPWQMHLTFARLKAPAPINLSGFKTEKIRFNIKSIDLMKSELSRAGAKYSLIEQFNLK